MENQVKRRRSLSDPGKETAKHPDVRTASSSSLIPHRGYLSDEEDDLNERISTRIANFRLREHRNSTVATGNDNSTSLISLLDGKVPFPSFGLSGFDAPTVARFVVTRVGLFRGQKRILTFTKDRVYVIRLDTGVAKASYPVRSCRLVPLDAKCNAGKEKFELRTDLRAVKQVYRSKERSTLLRVFLDIQDKASRDVVDRLYHAIKKPRHVGGSMLNVVLRVGPGSIETINPGDLKRNLRSPINVLAVKCILHRVKDHQCFALECKDGAFRGYLTLERESISRAICDAAVNLGENPPPIVMSDELPMCVPSGYILRMPVLRVSHSTGEAKTRELGITCHSVIELSDGSVRRIFPLKSITNVALETKGFGIILKLEWGDEHSYEMTPCIFTATSNPGHTERISPPSAFFHFWSANAPANREKSMASEIGGKESDHQATSLFGVRDGGFNFLTKSQAQWLFVSNLLSTARTVLEGRCSIGWGLQIPNMRFCMGGPPYTLDVDYMESLARRVVELSKKCLIEGEHFWSQHHKAAQRSFDRSSVPPESVLLIELLEEVNATVPASHFRANNIGPPPSLKGAATALLWLIQPEVMKHFPLYQVVSLLQATLRFVVRGAEEASVQVACPTILHFLREGERNPQLCFVAALLLKAIIVAAPLKFGSSTLRSNNTKHEISTLGKKLFSPSTNDSGTERLLIILSVCFPGRITVSSSSSWDRPIATSNVSGERKHPTHSSSASIIDCMSATKAVLLEIVSYFLLSSAEGRGRGNFNGSCSIAKTIKRMLNGAGGSSCYDIIITATRSPFVALASSASLLLRLLMDAGDRSTQNSETGGAVVNSERLRKSSRQSGHLLWCVLLSSDDTASTVLGEQFRLLLRSLCHYASAEGRRNAGVVSRSFPPGLLAPQPESAVYDEYGVPVGCLADGVTPWGWGTSGDGYDRVFMDWKNRVLGGELRTSEVIWTYSMRNKLVRRIRAELHTLDRYRSASNVDSSAECGGYLVEWNDIAWQIPWYDSHLTGGHVKVGRYFLLPLQEACDEVPKKNAKFFPPPPTLLYRFFAMCLQRLSVESESSVVELILDTMCLVLHCVEQQQSARVGIDYEGLALPTLRGIVNLIENGFPLLPEMGGYKHAAYFSSIRYLRYGISHHLGNARLFLMVDGIKTVLKLMQSYHINICHYFNGISDSKMVPETIMNGREDSANDDEILKVSIDVMTECILCLNVAWKRVNSGGCSGKGSSTTTTTNHHHLLKGGLLLTENSDASMAPLMVLLAELLEIGCCNDSEEGKKVASVLLKLVLQALEWVVNHKGSMERETETGVTASAAPALEEDGGSTIKVRMICLLLDLACRGVHPMLCAEVLAGEVFSPPLPELGLRGRGRALAANPLSRFLPGAMIRLLLTEGPKKFSQVLCMDENNGLGNGLQTPLLWWNKECCKVLLEIISVTKSEKMRFNTTVNGSEGDSGVEMGLKDPAAIRELYERKGGMPKPYIVPFYVSQLRVKGAAFANGHIRPELPICVYELGDEEVTEFISECATTFSSFASSQQFLVPCASSNLVATTTVSSPISSVKEVTQLAVRLLKFLLQYDSRTIIYQNNIARALQSTINSLLEAGMAITVMIHGLSNNGYSATTNNSRSFEALFAANDRMMKSSDENIGSVSEDLKIALEKLVECVCIAIQAMEPRGELVAASKVKDEQQQSDLAIRHELFGTVPVALNMANVILRCLKQLRHMASVVNLMNAINSVLRSITMRHDRCDQAMSSSGRGVCGLGDLITTMIEFLSFNKSKVVHNGGGGGEVNAVAQEGLHLATEIVGRQVAVGSTTGLKQEDDDLSLLLELSVHFLLLDQCLRWSPNCISDDSSCATLSVTAARALQALANSGNNVEINLLSVLLTSGLVSVLQRSPETFLMIASGSGGDIRCPHVVWTMHMKQELCEFLRHVATTSQTKSKKLEDMPSFCFSSLMDDPAIGGIYLRVIVEGHNHLPTAATSSMATAIGISKAHHHSSPPVSPPPHTAAALAAVKALCLPFPENLLEMVLKGLFDDIEVFLESRREKDTPPPTQSLMLMKIMVKRMEVCLLVVLGLAMGTEDGMRWLLTSENNRKRLWLVWELLPPSIEPSNLGEMAFNIHRHIIQLAHAIAGHDDSREGYYSGKGIHLLVSSGIACPLICLSYYLLRFGEAEGRDLAVAVFRVISGMTRASEIFTTHLITAGGLPWIISCLSASSLPVVARRECAIILSTLIHEDQVKDGKEGRPRGEVGVLRVVPEPLVAHLEANQLGTSILKLLDDKITAPTLMWDDSCRDKLHEMCYTSWKGWRPKLMSAYLKSNSSHHHRIPPSSSRWTVDDLPDKYPIPEGAEREPRIAGLYFRVYCHQPSFKLEETHVLAFLVAGSKKLGSLGLPTHKRLASDLLKSMFFALSTLPPERLAVISRAGSEKLWPNVFALIYNHKAESKLKLYGLQLVCLLLAVPGYDCPWNEAGASIQIQRQGAKATAQLLGSQIIDGVALQYLLMAIQAVVSSHTKEAMHATYSVIATPEVLCVLVTRLSMLPSIAETETTRHGHSGGVNVQSRSQDEPRRRKKNSVFFNKGPSFSKVISNNYSGSCDNGGYGIMTTSSATCAKFTVLMILANLRAHDIGGLATRRFLKEHSHDKIVDKLESTKIILDSEARKEEVVAMLQRVVPQVEEFHKVYAPSKTVAGFNPTLLPRMLQCIPTIDGSLFSQVNPVRRRSILGPEIVLPPSSSPLPPPRPQKCIAAATVMIHSPSRKTPTHINSPHSSSGCSNSFQKTQKSRILTERVGPPTFTWPRSPPRSGDAAAAKTIEAIESPIRARRG